MTNEIPTLPASFFSEVPTPCTHCGGVAHVDVMQRLAKKWTCYGCGLINRYVAPRER